MKERLIQGETTKGFELWSRWKHVEKYLTLPSVSITTVTLQVLNFGRSPRPYSCM